MQKYLPVLRNCPFFTGLTVRGFEEVVCGKHKEASLRLSLCRKRNMNCHLVAVEVRVVCGTGKHEYYVLQPVYDARSTVYIPTDSEKLASHARSLLSENEVYEIIDAMPAKGFEWVQNDKERSEFFRNVLESGTRTDIVNLISTLHNRKTELAGHGKKLRSSDEAIMQRAERLLYGEFAWVLGIDPSEVVDFIRKRVE